MAHGTVKNGVAEGTCTDEDVRICGVLTALAQTRYVTSDDGQIMGVSCKRERDQRYFAVTVMPHGKPQTTLTIVAPDTVKRVDDVYSSLRSWFHRGSPDTHIATPELVPPEQPVVVVEAAPVEISPNSPLRRAMTPEELSAVDLKPDHPDNPPSPLPAKLSPVGRKKMQRTVRPR
jgi:hypothetical protein